MIKKIKFKKPQLSKLRKRNLIALITISLIVVGLSAYILITLFNKDARTADNNRLVFDQIDQLDRASDCVNGLKAIEDNQPTDNDRDKLRYMFYKANCLAVTKKYEEARKEYNSILDYYTKKGDPLGINNVKQQLYDLDKLQKNDDGSPYTKPHLRTTPEGIYM